MIIKRFEKKYNRNEDTIIDECMSSETLYSEEFIPFVIVNKDFAFLFYDENDINWIRRDDAFSYKVEGSFNKTVFVQNLFGRRILLFVNKGKYPRYEFYGIYTMSNPYETISGVENAIDSAKPLQFILIEPDYIKE